MRQFFLFIFIIPALLFGQPFEIKTLEIGEKAPDFSLPAVDGKTCSLTSFDQSDILVIVFTCNHCPTAQAYEDRIIKMVKEYSNKSIAFVAISPNNPDAVALGELGYSDMGDSFEEMVIRARDKKFNFPYLYDGDTQKTAIVYGPVATPHVFVFDKQRFLCYTGRIDDMESPYEKPQQNDLINALEALLNGKTVPVEKTKTFGCSIKWGWKAEWREKLDKDWAEAPVALEKIDETGVKKLVQNKGEKLVLLNVWATWCGPCIVEFPEFIKMHRMYKERNFEFVSLSADKPSAEQKVKKFLDEKQSAVANYLFDSDDKYQLIEAVDKEWQGALPYTMLIAPGGKVLYKNMGGITPSEVKKAIVGYLGRYYADNK